MYTYVYITLAKHLQAHYLLGPSQKNGMLYLRAFQPKKCYFEPTYTGLENHATHAVFLSEFFSHIRRGTYSSVPVPRDKHTQEPTCFRLIRPCVTEPSIKTRRTLQLRSNTHRFIRLSQPVSSHTSLFWTAPSTFSRQVQNASAVDDGDIQPYCDGNHGIPQNQLFTRLLRLTEHNGQHRRTFSG